MRIPRNFGWAAARAREIWLDEGMTGLRHRSASYLQRRRLGPTRVHHRLPAVAQAGTPWPTSVVIVAAREPVQCYHYRVEQKIQICADLGIPVRVVDPALPHEVDGAVQIASHVIVYRQAAGPSVTAAVTATQRLGVPLIFEADDAVYRRDLLEANPNLDTIPRSLRRAVLTGADDYLAALRQAEHVIGSTSVLAGDMDQYVGGRAFVVENGIDELMVAVTDGLALDPAPPPRPADALVIGYGSGSRAHDMDLAVAAPGLVEVMSADPRVYLHLIGPVAVPSPLKQFEDRIMRTVELAYPEYLRQLAACDLTIAPLADIPFNRFKSQVKYLEAALVGVPLVASPTVYRDYVTDGLTARVADADAWGDTMTELLNDVSARRAISEAARADVAESHVGRRPADQFQAVVTELL